MTCRKTSRCGQHALWDEGWRLCSAIYFCCLVWPRPLNRMISRAHMLCELSGPPSGPELWTRRPAAVLSCLSSKFSYLLAQSRGQALLSSAGSSHLEIQNAHLGGKHLQWQRFSHLWSTFLFLCVTGLPIPDSALWEVPILNPVLGLWVEFPSG